MDHDIMAMQPSPHTYLHALLKRLRQDKYVTGGTREKLFRIVQHPQLPFIPRSQEAGYSIIGTASTHQGTNQPLTPIMTRSKDKLEKQDAEHAEVGEKHQTEKKSPQSKRAKTDTEKRETRSDTAKKSQKGEPQKSESQEGKPAPSSPPAAANGGAEKPGKEPDVPSNILEKGIIYFFIRGRVGIDDPSSVDEIRRSHILLRPIANDAKLGEGPIADAGNSRLVALPKKVLPLSGKDRFIAFVEKSAASFKTIKETYLEGSEYTTKTAGTRHNPPAKPAGEGVYAITTTGRESHLAYMLTVPEKLEEVQQELGLREKGSFIISTKNPDIKGPPNVQFKDKPDFPKE